MEWPLPLSGVIETDTLAAAATATQLTNPGSLNTKAAWTQLIAATQWEARELFIAAQARNASVADDTLLDVAIGAASSEQIIAADLYASGYPNLVGARRWVLYRLPIPVPKGSRLSARFQRANANTTYFISAHLIAGGFQHGPALSRCMTWGAASGDSGGTSVDPGASSNQKGAWTQLVAATEEDIRALSIGFGNQANNATTSGRWTLDIGVGAAAAESVLIPNVHLWTGTTWINDPQNIGPFPVSVPRGSRISARLSSSVTDATDRLRDIILYGFN